MAYWKTKNRTESVPSSYGLSGALLPAVRPRAGKCLADSTEESDSQPVRCREWPASQRLAIRFPRTDGLLTARWQFAYWKPRLTPIARIPFKQRETAGVSVTITLHPTLHPTLTLTPIPAQKRSPRGLPLLFYSMLQILWIHQHVPNINNMYYLRRFCVVIDYLKSSQYLTTAILTFPICQQWFQRIGFWMSYNSIHKGNTFCHPFLGRFLAILQESVENVFVKKTVSLYRPFYLNHGYLLYRLARD